MKSMIMLASLFLTFQVHASSEKTYTCTSGDYFATVSAAPGQPTLRAGIGEFVPSSRLNLEATRNVAESAGNIEVYDIAGQSNAKFVVYFDAKGSVIQFDRTQDGYRIQSFNGCSAN